MLSFQVDRMYVQRRTRQLSWLVVLRMRKEEVTGYFKELAQHLSGGKDKTTKIIAKVTSHSPRKSNLQSPKYEGDVLSPKGKR